MVSSSVHPLTHLLFRSLTTVSVYAVLFACVGKFSVQHLFPDGERLNLFVVVASSAFGTVCFFTALQFLSAADVAAILNSAPVFVTLGAYALLKEKFGIFQGISTIFVVVGVTFICKPSFVFGQNASSDQLPLAWLGIVFSILACVLLAASSVFCRKLKKTKTIYLVFYMNVFIFALSLLAHAALQDASLPGCGVESFWFVAGALFYITGMAFFFYSSTLMNSGKMSIFRGSSILFAYILQMIMLDMVPTWHTVVGAILMMSAPILASADSLLMTCKDRKSQQNGKDVQEREKMCPNKPRYPTKISVNIDALDLKETKI